MVNQKMHVIIPGFGSPHLLEKRRIFSNNLHVLSRYPFEWNLTVCIYDTNPTILQDLDTLIQSIVPPTTQWNLYQHPGIVGQFIKKYASPTLFSNELTGNIFLLLDDVELVASTWSWQKLLEDYQRFHLNIASPTMTLDSKYLFPFMLTKPVLCEKSIDSVMITSACEFFCYFMDLESYRIYYNEIDENHPWMWGIDLVLTKHLNMLIGMFHHLQMKHYFQNTTTYNEQTLEVFEKMNQYLSKFQETQQSLALQPAILEEYYIYHRPPYTQSN